MEAADSRGTEGFRTASHRMRHLRLQEVVQDRMGGKYSILKGQRVPAV